MLNESETRKIIDGQLRKVGWESDSDNLRYSNGTSPPSFIVKVKITLETFATQIKLIGSAIGAVLKFCLSARQQQLYFN